MKLFFLMLLMLITVNNNGLFAQNTNSSKKVNDYIEQIKGDSSWFELIKQKAIDQNITIDQALNNDALYMATKDSEQKIEEPTFTYFSLNQISPLLIGFFFAFLSLFFYYKKEKIKTSIILLMISAFCIRLFIVLVNGFINEWDEVFHVLVAKNMMENPFHPMLYKNPIFPFNELSWITSQTWLHKQPLFMWQMALSMKIFGISIFSIRLPSILMMSALVYLIYRIGKLSFNQNVGYLAAFLSVFSFYIIGLIVGAIFTDHNDIAFLFYVTASFWAWVEYEYATGRKKIIFLILIGVFSGAAVLVKWLVGLLVFSGWGLSILFHSERRVLFKNYFQLAISFVVSLLVFLPWQIYILNQFPTISRHEFSHGSKHFFEVIEDHGGDYWYYFDNMFLQYGYNPIFLTILFVFFIFIIKKSFVKTAIISTFIIVFAFFTLAATKMPSFTFVVSFLMFIIIASIIDKGLVFVSKNNFFKNQNRRFVFNLVVLTIIIMPMFNFSKIEEWFIRWSYFKQEDYILYKKQNNHKILVDLNNTFLTLKDYVVFNTLGHDNLSLMVFTDAKSAYSTIPSYEEYLFLKQNNHKIFVLDNGKLPDYIISDFEVIKYKSSYMW